MLAQHEHCEWDEMLRELTDEVRQDPNGREPTAQVTEFRNAVQRERMAQATLLHDLFGNPFRLIVIEPFWIRWKNGTIPKLAQAIYDERRFADLPILADALEEAGCESADLLGHCRQPGEHVRGCWVLDRLLGKE
jgi:hypothetical protein